MSNCIYRIIVDFTPILISIITLIFVGIGLRLWKVQLKGEDTFRLSLDVLRELKLVIFAINDYRHYFYLPSEMYEAYLAHTNGKMPDMSIREERELAAKYAEIDRWNKIIEQFNSYTDKILRLSILLDDYNIDLVDGKRLKDFLLNMSSKRMDKEFADADRGRHQFMSKEQRNEVREEYEKINTILQKPELDTWGDELEQYFNALNKRLRKYTK